MSFLATLYGLKAGITFADNVKPPFSFHDLAIRMALFRATQ